MKRLLLIFLAATSLLVPLSAPSALTPLPPTSGTTPPFLGATHAYSVTFRGNGEAVVYERIQWMNTTKNPQKEFTIRIPTSIQTSDVKAYQVTTERSCVDSSPQPLCLQYDEAENYEYPGRNVTYEEAKLTTSGDTITIELLNPIAPDKRGNLLLTFRAFGYTKKTMVGGFTYSFETLKTVDPLYSVTVGISAEEPMMLSGARGKTNYRFEETLTKAVSAVPSADMAQSQKMMMFRDFYWMVGQGDITKNATNLQSLESFTVKGMFAQNFFQLYAKETAIGIVILLISLFIFVKTIQKIMHMVQKNEKNVAGRTNLTESGKLMAVVATSFVVSLVMLGFTIILVYWFRTIVPTISYDLRGLIGLFSVVLAIAVYGFLLVAPPILIGIKFGGLAGIGNFGLTLLFLIIQSFIALLVVALLGNSNPQRIMPMMDTIKSSTQTAPANPE